MPQADGKYVTYAEYQALAAKLEEALHKTPQGLIAEIVNRYLEEAAEMVGTHADHGYPEARLVPESHHLINDDREGQAERVRAMKLKI